MRTYFSRIFWVVVIISFPKQHQKEGRKLQLINVD
jgi:hypothetical protein